MIKLKELDKLLKVKLPNKQKVLLGFSEILCADEITGSNKQKEIYDNLEIPIEKLKPSIEEIEKCINSIVNDEDKKVWTYYTLAQAIYNIKPGGIDNEK